MSRVEATPGQLAVTQAQMQGLRESLLTHAIKGATAAGFADHETRVLATMMTLIGAAQMYALTHRSLYAVFKALCLDMANSQADATVTARFDLGPEYRGGKQ